jgi:hypothetical protein
MTLFALGAGIFFGLALIARELQLARERTIHVTHLQGLRQSLESTRAQLRRCTEDLFVLQAVLAERNLCNEGELSRGRLRLIEAPRRQAEERESVSRHLGVSQAILMVEDGEGKIH